jgi:hypothetical protein
VVLSKDLGIRTNLIERTLLLDSGVQAFLFADQKAAGHVIASAFVRALRRIRKLHSTTPRQPLIARVSRSGGVQVLEDVIRAWRRERRKRRRVR